MVTVMIKLKELDEISSFVGKDPSIDQIKVLDFGIK